MAATMAAVNAPAAAALSKSEFVGTTVAAGVPSLAIGSSRRSPLSVRASGGKKIQTKTPLGLSGDTKFRAGADASGSKSKGKGVYQFAKKYGANVDGYSPIWAPEEWAPTGEVYAPGPSGLALWALTLGAVLLGGVLLVYNTSALVN